MKKHEDMKPQQLTIIMAMTMYYTKESLYIRCLIIGRLQGTTIFAKLWTNGILQNCGPIGVGF